MSTDNIFIYVMPVCDFSSEESETLSLEQLDELTRQDKIVKYRLENFIIAINDEFCDCLTESWIALRTANDMNSLSIRI